MSMQKVLIFDQFERPT